MALLEPTLDLRPPYRMPPRRVPVEDLAPRALVEALVGAFPGLRRRPGVLRLATHLLLTPYRDGEVVPTPNGLLADVFEKPELYEQRRFLSKPVFERLADALETVAPGGRPADVVLYPFDYRHKKSYAVELRGLPPELVQAAREARDVPADDLITLDGWVRVTVRGRARGLHGDPSAIRSDMVGSLREPVGAVALTLRLQEYLNGLDPRVFAPLKSEISTTDTGAAVRELVAEGRARGEVVATLRSVLEQPVPIYQTSPKTPRVHAVRRNATALPSQLRQWLTDRLGWVELDLAHAQLSCNAAAWGVDDVLGVLADPEYDLWADLVGWLGPEKGELSEIEFGRLKALLKPPLHGVSFGMRARNVRRLGLEEGSPAREDAEFVTGMLCRLTVEEAGARLAEHTVVGAMLEARGRQRAAVKEAGGRRDVLGKWHSVERDVDWKKVLARCTQAHEMALLEPVVDDAIAEASGGRRPRYRIVLWQHDGFTVSPKGGDEAGRRAVARRLQRLVADRARELGVPTRLKVDVGPGPE